MGLVYLSLKAVKWGIIWFFHIYFWLALAWISQISL